MRNSNVIKLHLGTIYKGLFGVVLLFFLPGSTSAFQADSLQLSQNLTGLENSASRFGDYDGDGDLDLIVGGDSASVRMTILYKNDGNGVFTKDNTNSITAVNYPAFAWGDIDGDGDLDLVMSGNTGSGYIAKIYTNNGSGVLSEVVSDPLIDVYWGDFEFGDFDGDGDLDLFQNGAQAVGGNITVLFYNDGTGSFTQDAVNSFVGTGDGDLVVADIDNDGDLDFINNGFGPGGYTSIYKNNGSGSFTASQSLDGVYSSGLDFGDFNNDGYLDIILMGLDNGTPLTKIYLNNGTGYFNHDNTNAFAFPVGKGKAKFGDYDHDGDVDVFLAGTTSNHFIYVNNGSNVINGLSTSFTNGTDVRGLELADLDNDGFLDLFVTGKKSNGDIFSDVYKSIRTKPVNAPASPTNLAVTNNGITLSFSWDASTDAEGGSISYDMFLYDSGTSKYVIPATANINSGKRKVSGLGNTGLRTVKTISSSEVSNVNTINWGVQAIDAAGNSSPFKVTASVEPPENLSSQVIGSSVLLTWNALQDSSLASYRVYSSTDSTTIPTLLASTTDTSFTATIGQRGTEFYYAVASVDTNGAESFLSRYVLALVPPIEVTIDSVQLADFRATIVWNSVSGDDFQSFKVYQTSDTTATDSLVATLTDTTFTSGYLNRNSTYYFKIAAVDTNDAVSIPTNYQAFTIPSLEVSGLILEEIDFTTKLTWNLESAEDFESFKVYQTTDTTGSKTLLATQSDTTFTTDPLARGATYYFAISILDSTGTEGPFSDYVSMDIPSLTPENLTLELIDTSVKSSWNSRNEGDFQAYKLYMSSDTTATDSLLTTTTDTTFTTGELERSVTYYFRVSAVDTMGLESAKSFYGSLKIPDILDNSTPINYPVDQYKLWGDLNNDGFMDQVVGRSNSYKVYFGKADSSYEIIDVNVSMDWLKDLKDINNDGKLDIVTYERYIVYDDTLKTFSHGHNPGGSGTWLDVDNDGDYDFFDDLNQVIKINNGSGFVGDSSIVPPFYIDTFLHSVDIDGDGYKDIVRVIGSGAGDQSGDIYIYLYNDGLDFTNPITISKYSYSNLIGFADLDNDNRVEIIINDHWSPAPNRLYSFEYNGNGTFNEVEVFDDETDYLFVIPNSFNDYDGDGDLDLLAGDGHSSSSGSPKEHYLLINDGSGLFTLSEFSFTIISSSGFYYSLLNQSNLFNWIDLDNDGDIDLETWIYTNGTPSYTNTTFLNYLDPNTSASPQAPSEPKIIDVNENEINISWSTNPSDTGAFHSFNFSLVNTETNKVIVSSNSDASNGFRRLPGITDWYKNSFKLKASSLTEGNYKFKVQTINSLGKGSAFLSVDIPFGNLFEFDGPGTIVMNSDTSSILSDNEFIVHPTYRDSLSTFAAYGNYSGSVFVDENDNGRYDDGETKLDSNKVDIINIIDTKKVLYNPLDGSLADIKIIYETTSLSDSIIINTVNYESTPSISGIAGEAGWYLLSNPFETTLGTLFGNIWTQGAINADSETGTPNLYVFNGDSAKYVAITTDLDTTKVSTGEGILAYIFPDDNYNDSEAPINGGWPKVLSNYGDPFGENISIPIKNIDIDGNGVTSGSEGFKLMGNPYGFAVSVDSLVAELIKIDPYANRYVYRWDPVNKQYNLNFTGSVNAYESFFIRTIQSGISGSASLDYGDVHSSARLKQIQPKNMIEMNLFAGGISTGQYTVKLGEEAETGIDPYDGYYLGSYASNYANLYSTIGDQPLVLNNLPLGLSEVLEIPLFLHSTESGEHRIEWSLNDIPEGWMAEIENPNTGEVISLESQSSYSFDFQSAKEKADRDFSMNADLFGFMEEKSSEKEKTLKNSSDLILRISPELATNNETDLDIPLEVELYQNYPNPFNPSSVIRFGVPTKSRIKLEVFDILGRKVATLLNGDSKSAGRYNVQFRGDNLASGMYLYRLEVADKVLVKKMILIK